MQIEKYIIFDIYSNCFLQAYIQNIIYYTKIAEFIFTYN